MLTEISDTFSRLPSIGRQLCSNPSYLFNLFLFFTLLPSEATQGSTEDVLVLFERQAMPYQVCLNIISFSSPLLPQRGSSKPRWQRERDSIHNSRGLVFSLHWFIIIRIYVKLADVAGQGFAFYAWLHPKSVHLDYYGRQGRGLPRISSQQNMWERWEEAAGEGGAVNLCNWHGHA